MKTMNFREELGKVCPKAKQGANIYFFGCGKHFEDVRAWYRSFANISIEDYAFAFIDNDANKQGKEFYGKPVVSPDSVSPENSVVLITAENYLDCSIDRQMMDRGFFWGYDLMGCLTTLQILKSWIFSNFMEFKDKHKGERCFIIGGGASLRASDLDMLKNEKTFAMNKIYKIFDKTEWRPTYYVTEDALMAKQYRIINEYIKGCKFFDFEHCLREINNDKDFQFDKNAHYFTLIKNMSNRPAEYKKPGFGKYPDEFYYGFTSTYSCLQLAAFMGFKEIYLVGIDHEYSVMITNSGEIIFSEKRNHFTNEYHKGGIMEQYQSQGFHLFYIDNVTAAYQSAREYAENNGITIKNATRGGKLEVFERVSFDELFDK